MVFGGVGNGLVGRFLGAVVGLARGIGHGGGLGNIQRFVYGVGEFALFIGLGDRVGGGLGIVLLLVGMVFVGRGIHVGGVLRVGWLLVGMLVGPRVVIICAGALVGTAVSVRFGDGLGNVSGSGLGIGLGAGIGVVGAGLGISDDRGWCFKFVGRLEGVGVGLHVGM